MADGGSHFDNHAVGEFCEGRHIKRVTTPLFAPWANGLSEGSNKIMLGRICCLAAPSLDESAYIDVDPESLSDKWPDYLDKAIRQMNDRVLPATGYTPREILFGI
ncbi:hypothetical protein BOTBODRAFT_96904, partial [Botryobasidium botryosum FD-172 SS1]